MKKINRNQMYEVFFANQMAGSTNNFINLAANQIGKLPNSSHTHKHSQWQKKCLIVSIALRFREKKKKNSQHPAYSSAKN